MANVLFLLAFLALAAASADARVIHRLQHGRSLSAGEKIDAIHVCDHVTFPKLCRALLPTLSNPITAESLTAAAITKTIIKNEEAMAAASRLMADPQTTQQVKETLGVCQLGFQAALVNMNESVKLLNNRDLDNQVAAHKQKHEKVMVHMQNALALVGNCDDAFSELPGVMNPVAHITGHLEKLTSNGLSLSLGAVDY